MKPTKLNVGTAYPRRLESRRARSGLRVESLAQHLEGRDVRAIVRGALDRKTFWVLFGPGDSGGYRVDSYIKRRGSWRPGGDSLEGEADANSGWDLLGALFVRAFTEA